MAVFKPRVQPPPPCGALWVYALGKASAQAQQHKILISDTIGAFGSRKRGATTCGSQLRYKSAADICWELPTENSVSVDTMLTFLSWQPQAAGSRQ